MALHCKKLAHASESAACSASGETADNQPVKAASDCRRFPTVGDVLMMLLLFFVSQVLVATVLALFGIAIPDSSVVDTGNIEEFMQQQMLRGESIAIVYPVSMAVSVIAILLYVGARSGNWRIARFSASGFNPNIILSGIAWIVVAQIVLEPVMELLPHFDNAGVGRGFWACVTAMFFAPVLEELLCRGIVLETLRRRWSNFVAVAVSALFFGIVHVEPATALAGVVVGFVFGMIYLRTQSLFSVMILHSVNNAIALALICLDMDGVSFREMIGNDTAYFSAYAASCLLFALFFVEISRKVFRRK